MIALHVGAIAECAASLNMSVGGATDGSGNLSTSLSNFTRLAAKICVGFQRQL
jgi:hypothetical protein